jgi:hypothetical protein
MEMRMIDLERRRRKGDILCTNFFPKLLPMSDRTVEKRRGEERGGGNKLKRTGLVSGCDRIACE